MASLNLRLPTVASRPGKGDSGAGVASSSQGASPALGKETAPADQGRKRRRRGKSPRGGIPVPPAPTASVPRPPTPSPPTPVFLPGCRMRDGNYLIPDVSDVQVEAMLKLPPRFSVICQALYESVMVDHWNDALKSKLVDRQRQAISHQLHGVVLSILNLLELVGVEEHAEAIDRIESDLKALLDAEKTAHQEDNELASKEIAGLQDELKQLKAEVDELKRQEERAQRQADEDKERYRAEGYDQGKRDGERSAVENYLSSNDFVMKRDQIVEDFMASEELVQIRTADLQSAGEQIVEQIRQHLPDVDLSFLYNPPPEAGGDGSTAADGGDEDAAGGEA